MAIRHYVSAPKIKFLEGSRDCVSLLSVTITNNRTGPFFIEKNGLRHFSPDGTFSLIVGALDGTARLCSSWLQKQKRQRGRLELHSSL